MKSFMTTEALTKQLSKEMVTLKRDVADMKAILLKVFDIQEKSIHEYENEITIMKSYRNAQKRLFR